jgi:hypothetical protein
MMPDGMAERCVCPGQPRCGGFGTPQAAPEAARGSFHDAAAAIGRACGVRIGKRQVEALAARAAADVDAFYAVYRART